MREEAIDAAIIGASGLAGLAAAAWVTAKVVKYLPAAVAPYAQYIGPVIPFVGALVASTQLRRYDSRVAVGVSAGMSAYGVYMLAKQFLPDSVTTQVPLKGLGEYALLAGGVPDMGIDQYLRGLEGAPITVDQLSGAPMTIETLSGNVPFAATLQ